MYEPGTIFKIKYNLHREEEEYYILAQTDYGMFTLISLKDGNRWCEPIKSSFVVGIGMSEEDLKRIINDGYKKTHLDEDEKEIVINNIIQDRNSIKIEESKVNKNIQELQKIKELLLKEEKE